MVGSNYKYLYDEATHQFFVRKTTPIYTGTFAVSDLIMNKIIFLEIDGDNARLKVTHMKNHGMSF